MTLSEFERLLPQFKQAFSLLEQQREALTVRSGSERVRSIGGGKKFAHQLEDQLLLLLLYYRFYLTQGFMTLLFTR
jgi:hypothetical protein